MAGLITGPPPFLPAPGLPTYEWEDWIEMFETFLEAGGGGGERAELGDNRVCALLRNALGGEGQLQYRAIAGVEPKCAAGSKATEYDKMVARLRDRFGKRRGVIAARLEFNARKQHPGEPFDDLLASLRLLLPKCAFESYGPE